MKIRVNLNQEETEIDVTRQGSLFVIVRDGQRYEATLVRQEGHTFLLQYTDGDGRKQYLQVAGAAQGDKRQLWVNGRSYHYQRVRETAAGQDSGSGSLSAAIPAVVAEVLITVGDMVAPGDKLILLESMKMVIPIQAPTAGKVTAIHCVAGDSVQPGVPLVTLEEVETATD